MFYLAATLLVCIGITHSYLGERYILIRLFRLSNLPDLFGSSEFTINTLRFAWHLTTISWFGFAALLLYLPDGNLDKKVIGNIIGTTFSLHAALSLVRSKGKQFSWFVFLIIGLITLYASNI